MMRSIGYLAILLGFCAALLPGCGTDAAQIDEAYSRGYTDGVASLQDQILQGEQAYQDGYDAGLAAAEEQHDADLCQSCYGLGFNDGYEAGLAADKPPAG
ncbi:MAG: hypothetical protein GX600_01280 [Dehalococcoidia bacterium]|jgi:ribosome modulation factor|nr:hypothetical protein [Dehalococcoidia bacterium]